MKKMTLSALAAAGLLASLATGANAADLGGNCCADLEERVAELEATTARKGNRKVSLTISGWVAEQVTWWDDGVESNTYVTGIGSTLATNVKFTGQATISPGWSAGYVLQLEADGSDSLGTSQSNVSGGTLMQPLQSYWFIKSDTLGKISIGKQSSPSDNAAILVDGSGSLVPANWVAFDAFGFAIRQSSGTAAARTWGTAGACAPGDCFAVPTNNVRYDSPTFAGFSASASWGQDDQWDVALRYAGEVSGFKVAATVTYGEDSDATSLTFNNGGSKTADVDYTQAGLYIQHVATGLFGLVNYGTIDVAGSTLDPDTWYFKGGLRQRWSALGHTVLYGEYMISEEGQVASSKYEWWGVGVVQEIDNAAMSVYAKYRQHSYEETGRTYEDLDQFSVGGLINF